MALLRHWFVNSNVFVVTKSGSEAFCCWSYVFCYALYVVVVSIVAPACSMERTRVNRFSER